MDIRIRSGITSAAVGVFLVAGALVAPAANASESAGPDSNSGPVTYGLHELVASEFGSVSERALDTVTSTPENVGTARSVALANTTWTREYTNNFANNLGGNIIRHTGIVQWTGDGSGNLISSPRALTNSTWSITGINYQGGSTSWNWYNAGQGGTAQGTLQATFLLGIPTPWGNIGQTTNSVIIVQTNGYGGAGRVN